MSFMPSAIITLRFINW